MTDFSIAASPIDFADLLRRPRPIATRLTYGSQPNQFGDLSLPAGHGPYPVVVMMHGGCWQAGLPGVELMSYIADDLRRDGFAVWNIEYRRLGNNGGGYPGTFLDIADGVDYLRQIKNRYQLDLSHLTIIGHSAGGQLALWSAARSQLKPDNPLYRAHPLPVKKVVTLAGINDLENYRDTGPGACGGPRTIDNLVGAQDRNGRNLYGDTSPAAMLPISVQQLIVSGDQDPIVPAQFGQDYASKAKAAGDAVEIIDIKDAGHFELIDPTSDAWHQIKDYLLH